MTIREVEQQIVEEFSIFTDWMDKYEYLIELGKTLPIIKEGEKLEGNLIKGCQSRVWLNAEFKNGLIYFTADSDAIITKGIISLLIRVFSERTPKEIIDADLNFIKEIGLQENLSPTRANGLLSMIKQIKIYAMAYSA
ncbi:MAG: Fe-S metabolism protein SufE [Bacteroidetes bacterium GWE2_39_28]|jgi:cysteine desulfuration protein SufE|nr:MAG: Fe-S metabolism protein SufE [Bacteroidetes bacterium GWE2_39_28]OFY12320.1 MAG: Fe-S metabolism protein SufE [Bacteroidetes bacterium GWF2_39_10]OFZ07067.1 MAG: Fe-S metabolism protein SufE [Bacteroidetes bacterium RIFOXYB2_FULL_39_7]OFZ11969.1 MAG: Fe-S metabolism protein SufE [Bacteroidetes bacterium RIFOXYC2_FULL_39_11]HCT95048.1 Fe-S metabolism protein SufE [Rikenellaceae bacterium]